jgi:hypothetical protein
MLFVYFFDRLGNEWIMFLDLTLQHLNQLTIEIKRTTGFNSVQQIGYFRCFLIQSFGKQLN